MISKPSHVYSGTTKDSPVETALQHLNDMTYRTRLLERIEQTEIQEPGRDAFFKQNASKPEHVEREFPDHTRCTTHYKPETVTFRTLNPQPC